MSDYISRGFTFTSRTAVYRCVFHGETVGEEKWVVDIRYIGTEPRPVGRYELPKTWARTMVFQFLNGLDEGKREQVEALQNENSAHWKRNRFLENELLALGWKDPAGPLLPVEAD